LRCSVKTLVQYNMVGTAGCVGGVGLILSLRRGVATGEHLLSSMGHSLQGWSNADKASAG
jgi:hypothetical protein